MLLGKDRAAIVGWVIDCFPRPSAFQLFLAKHGCTEPPIFDVEPRAIETVGMTFAAWLWKNHDAVEAVMTAAVTEFPAHASRGLFCDLAARFAEMRIERSARPWEAALVEGIPVVNRDPLRAILKRMLRVNGPGVAMINGPSGCGRSHSWHLIWNVARSVPCQVFRIDLGGLSVEERTIGSLFEMLADKLGLLASRPTAEGATAETVASKYARVLADSLSRRTEPFWLVFDGLDAKSTMPEIRLFVGHLAKLRLEHEMMGGKIFLIGADGDFDLDDRFGLVQTETVSDLLPSEFRRTATAINAMGENPLGDLELQAWVDTAISRMRILRNHQAGDLVARSLVQLRNAVEAM